MPVSDALKLLLTERQAAEKLPASYVEQVETYLLPIAAHIATHHERAKKALFWGVSGSQGSGKSTLVHFLAHILRHHYRLSVAVLSLDDFYCDQAEREQLADACHPLFRTRGVPGTHRVALAMDTFDRLARGEATPLPRFDKATDNPFPESAWPLSPSDCDIVLFEGWCVGAVPQAETQLDQPLNLLEAEEDPDGRWRREVNRQLQQDYAAWWQRLDGLLLLLAPSFEQVHEWRRLQEHKLRQRFEDAGQVVPAGVMDDSQISRFIQHYERLTRWILQVLPNQADIVLNLQPDHRWNRLILQPREAHQND